MAKKLNSILLVDDDNDCNFFHERLIKKMEYAEHVYIVNNGREAIDFLKSKVNGKHPHPDIIFLDINMPIMNGWEFIEEYQKLQDNQKAKVMLIMLTTSLNPDDLEHAKQYKDIKGYKNKYLDKESMSEILKEFFSEEVS